VQCIGSWIACTESQSQSQSYFKTGCLPPISLSWRQAPWDSRPATSFQLNICFPSFNVTSSLTRGRVCHLQLLLGLASALILRSESCETHGHILLSRIRDFPNLEGQVPVFISSRNWVARLHPQALGSLFVDSYDSQGNGGSIRNRLHTGPSTWCPQGLKTLDNRRTVEIIRDDMPCPLYLR
jgi:hypothetical protein